MKTKIIKKLYGGDAMKVSQLSIGDWMTVDLINKAIEVLLKEAYLTKTRIKVRLTETQVKQIEPTNAEYFAMIYWMPIETHTSSGIIQVGYISCNNKQINIYTMRE